MTNKDQNNSDPGSESTAASADNLAHDWHPADIVAALHKAGWTVNKLAHHHGLTSSVTLSRAMRSSYPAGEKRIADALGLHPKVIWPSRYYANGEAKPRGDRAINYTPISESGNAKKSDVKPKFVERRKHDRRSS